MATSADALVAAEVAAALGRPLLLVSPRGGAAALGPAMFAAVVERARERHPPTRGLIDCEDVEGDALLALRVGIDGVIYKGRAAIRDKLAAIAAASGRCVVAERPATLALGREKDMAAACRRWLGEEPGQDSRI